MSHPVTSVCASAAPSSWHTGVVLVAAGVVCLFVFCCPHTSGRAIHNLPHSVSMCMRPRCPAPPRVVPAVHHVRPPTPWVARAQGAPCWLRVACASWLMRVACAPAQCPGCFTLHCYRAVVLGSAHPGFVGVSFPCLAHHSFPQCASGAPVVARWVLDPLGTDEQRRCAAGAPGLAPWVPDPLCALVAPQNASGP